ncbi:unnamed protein product [Sphagnum troendelagicum]|uniref:Rhodanese domain-containing protein n=1 Tax=Sphagnum troendelagicum TaxID=128251 RepID=A0ABP0UJD1_9BRYO
MAMALVQERAWKPSCCCSLLQQSRVHQSLQKGKKEENNKIQYCSSKEGKKFVRSGATRAQAEEKNVVKQRDEESSSSSRGWFYDKFVAENTMEAKLAKFKGDVAARGGYVGSWFQDSFKYTAWVEVHRKLTERDLQSLECQEACKLAKSGEAILLDCRESPEFVAEHAEGAFSAPLFRQIQGDDTKANLRRLGYALLTNFAGTERNPAFVQAAVTAVGGEKNKKSKLVIVYCAIGGTLDTFVERKGAKAKKFKDPERLFGRQSRSLKAAYELLEAGFTNVVHLKGGFNQWTHLQLPTATTTTAAQGSTAQG